MTHRTLLAWFAVGHLANDWPIAALWLVLPAAGLALDLAPGEVGLLFTVAGLGGALAYLPAGMLADRVANRGRLLVATVWWVAAGYGLAAMAPGFWSLALLLSLAGMGNAAWHPIATGVLSRAAGDRRAHALGMHAVGGTLAEVLAPLFAGVLLAHLGWRGALAISALPALLFGVCFVRAARTVPQGDRAAAGASDLRHLLAAWRRTGGLRLVALICAYNMALMALLSMIPLYLAAARGLAPATVGLVFAGLLIAGALAQPWVGRVSDIVGRRPVLVAGNLAAGLAGAMLVFEPPFWPMIAAMAVAVGASDAIRAAVLATAVDRAERGHATALGIAFVLLDGVGALGALLAGLAAGVSWPHMFALAASLSLAAAALAGAPAFGRRPDTAAADTERR